MKTQSYFTRFFVGILFVTIFLFGSYKSAIAYCEPSPSGNFTINSSCTFAKLVTGVDGGEGETNTARLTVNSGVLTINANQSLIFGTLELTGGSISVDTGAQMRSGIPIWMIDADGDGYPATLTEYAQVTPPTNGRRRYLMTSITEVDCSETFYSTTNTCCTQKTWYRDVDGDGYGNPAGPTTIACDPVPSGYSANNTDCDDTKASVYHAHAACYWDLDLDSYTNGNVSGRTCLNSTSCNTATYGSTGGGSTPVAYTAGVLKNTANGADCDDNQALVYHNHAACYWDYDRDGYTNGNASGKTCLNSTSCNTATYGTVPSSGEAPVAYLAGALKDAANGTDCGPNTDTAYPGSATCSSTSFLNASGVASHDYNCDGTGTKCGTIYDRSTTSTTTWYTQDTGSCKNCNMQCGSGSNQTYGTASFACGQTGAVCSSFNGYSGGSCSCKKDGCSYGCQSCSGSAGTTNLCNGITTGVQRCN